MNNEFLKVNSPGLNEPGVERLDYHAPKFVSLGPIQSLVLSSPGASTNDGGGEFDGSASGGGIP